MKNTNIISIRDDQHEIPFTGAEIKYFLVHARTLFEELQSTDWSEQRLKFDTELARLIAKW